MFTVIKSIGCHALWRRFLCGVMAVWIALVGCLLPAYGEGIDEPAPQNIPLSGMIISAGQEAIPPPPASISARSAVLVEASTGTVIYGHNSNVRLPMASTTKIMTALVALEAVPRHTAITIPPEAVGIEGSSVYLCEGEILTLEELLYALLLASANDAAVAIALSIAGSVDGFADLMNKKAEDLGLVNTHFVNPHGLDHPEHYTTAAELAIITREAMNHPTFRQICATERKTISLHGEEGVRLLVNHNKLLSSYDGCIGVKTGYTKKTGRCLVSAAERNGVTLIAVTLGDPDDWQDHHTLLDYGFSVCEEVILCNESSFTFPLWVISGEQEYVMVENPRGLRAVVRRDHGEIRCTVELPRFVFAAIGEGEIVGRLLFTETMSEGSSREIGSVDLTACYGVDEIRCRPTLDELIKEWFFP